MNTKFLNNLFKGDKVVWMVFFFLCVVSIIEVYSASSQLSYKSGAYFAPVVKHTLFILGGVGAMVITLNMRCRFFKVVTPFALALSFVLLIWVYFAGQVTNGAQRWVNILGIQFQPSEIAKGAMVLATAQILSAMQTEHGADKRAMKYVLFIGAFIILPILFENLSTAVLLSLVVLMMMYVGRVPKRQLGTLVSIGVIGVALAVFVILNFGKEIPQPQPNKQLTEQVQGKAKAKKSGGLLHRMSTWRKRLLDMNAPEVPPEEVDLDGDRQKAHAKIAIATGNPVGKGPGNSEERDFLPQAFSDFIFAIIVEEMGIEGAVLIVGLYIILLFRTAHIARQCENAFPALLAMGLALLLCTQAVLNMCVGVGYFVTGQTLPLVSRGGTSIIINCVYMGMILSVSRTAKKKNVQPQPAIAKN